MTRPKPQSRVKPPTALDATWMEEARCARLTDEQKEWFTSSDPSERQAAKNVCSICPVRAPCRVLGESVGWGVYGGKAYGQAGPDLADCGPDAASPEGVARHRELGDQMCSRCRAFSTTRARTRADVTARNDAIRKLINRGHSNTTIMARLGVSWRIAERVRNLPTAA